MFLGQNSDYFCYKPDFSIFTNILYMYENEILFGEVHALHFPAKYFPLGGALMSCISEFPQRANAKQGSLVVQELGPSRSVPQSRSCPAPHHLHAPFLTLFDVPRPKLASTLTSKKSNWEATRPTNPLPDSHFPLPTAPRSYGLAHSHPAVQAALPARPPGLPRPPQPGPPRERPAPPPPPPPPAAPASAQTGADPVVVAIRTREGRRLPVREGARVAAEEQCLAQGQVGRAGAVPDRHREAAEELQGTAKEGQNAHAGLHRG